MPIVGLFGTCGGSKWRDSFIHAYSELGIKFYNPFKEHWTPACAVEEAEHLVQDDVILFPVTGETYGFGSLAETGYSIQQAIKITNKLRFVIIFIDMNISDDLKDEVARRETIKSRKLIMEHLKKVNQYNVIIVNSLEQMFDASIKCLNIVNQVDYLKS